MTDLAIGMALPTMTGEIEAPGIGVADAARHVERLGLESVWVPDLITGDGTPVLEATVALAAARRFAAAGRRGWAVFSAVTGGLFLATWISIFALQGVRAANVAFAIAIELVLVWTSLLAAHELTRTAAE